MKKVPSVRANNEMRDRAASELRSLVYQLEKGKFNKDLDRESVAAVAETLAKEAERLENAVGTGAEQIAPLFESALAQMKELKKCSEQNLFNRFEKCADDLLYTLGCWQSVLSGETGNVDENEWKREKVGWTRRNLNARLEEVAGVKQEFSRHSERLEEEIVQLEKDLSDLDNQMLKEDNERKINDLYRKISSLKSKLNMLNIRRSNYSACYNILDMIEANAAEIVEAGDIAGEEIGKAKALLNIGRLRSVLSEPDRAMAILKRMQDDINQLAERTKAMDKKIFAITSSQTVVSGDALKYKEELMRKSREVEQVRSDGDALEAEEPVALSVEGEE